MGKPWVPTFLFHFWNARSLNFIAFFKCKFSTERQIYGVVWFYCIFKRQFFGVAAGWGVYCTGTPLPRYVLLPILFCFERNTSKNFSPRLRRNVCFHSASFFLIKTLTPIGARFCLLFPKKKGRNLKHIFKVPKFKIYFASNFKRKSSKNFSPRLRRKDSHVCFRRFYHGVSVLFCIFTGRKFVSVAILKNLCI